MPLIFTKDQIKQHLTDLGFDNISDEQLKLFIQDLKKLIKHEERKRYQAREKENEYPITPSSYSTERVSSLVTSGSRTTNDDVVDIPSLNLGKKPDNLLKHVQQPIIKQAAILKEKENMEPEKKPVTASTNNTNPSKPFCSSASDLFSSFYSESDLSDSLSDGSQKRSRLPPKSVRHDPVSLYHFYKSIWDKQKSPGEDPRMRLRWNVRAGTLGRVPCDPCGNRTKYLR